MSYDKLFGIGEVVVLVAAAYHCTHLIRKELRGIIPAPPDQATVNSQIEFIVTQTKMARERADACISPSGEPKP